MYTDHNIHKGVSGTLILPVDWRRFFELPTTFQALRLEDADRLKITKNKLVYITGRNHK